MSLAEFAFKKASRLLRFHHPPGMVPSAGTVIFFRDLIILPMDSLTLPIVNRAFPKI